MSYVIVAERSDAPTYYRTKRGSWVTGFRMSEVKVFPDEEVAKNEARAISVTSRKIRVRPIA